MPLKRMVIATDIEGSLRAIGPVYNDASVEKICDELEAAGRPVCLRGRLPREGEAGTMTQPHYQRREAESSAAHLPQVAIEAATPIIR